MIQGEESCECDEDAGFKQIENFHNFCSCEDPNHYISLLGEYCIPDCELIRAIPYTNGTERRCVCNATAHFQRGLAEEKIEEG